MSDIIAIFRKGDRFSVGFCIDQAWSPVYDLKGVGRTWRSAEKARSFLRLTARSYESEYGEAIGWDVETVPVVNLAT